MIIHGGRYGLVCGKKGRNNGKIIQHYEIPYKSYKLCSM
jgi:hypothetical protein